MTRTERLITLLRLLRSHNDGLTMSEIMVMLQIKKSAFYEYISALRNMGFDIHLRKNGRYVFIMGRKTEQTFLDHFPKLIINQERANLKLRYGFKVVYTHVFSVTDILNDEITFFTDVPTICARYPELTIEYIYNLFFRSTKNRVKIENYIINRGPLLDFNDKINE